MCDASRQGAFYVASVKIGKRYAEVLMSSEEAEMWIWFLGHTPLTSTFDYLPPFQLSIQDPLLIL